MLTLECSSFLIFTAIWASLLIKPASLVEDDVTKNRNGTGAGQQNANANGCSGENLTRDTNITFLNSSYAYPEPEFDFVSCTAIRCVSSYHIRWMVSFQPALQINRTVGLPYELQFEWKSCSSTMNTGGNTCSRNGYFSSYLRFNNSLMHSPLNFESVEIKCISTSKNSTSSSTWNVTLRNTTLNLRNGTASRGLLTRHNSGAFPNVIGETNLPKKTKDASLLPTYSSLPGSNVTLEWDNLHNNYSCVNSHATKTHRPIEFLNCTDWANCQQMAAHLFKTVLEGSVNRSLQTSFDVSNKNLTSFTSGIIYCRIDDERAFYWPFFKTWFSNKQFMHIIPSTRVEDAFLKNITNLSESMDLEIEDFQDFTVRMKCSAPKYLAIKGFEWTVINSNDPSNNLFSTACKTTRHDTIVNYAESCTCKTPVTSNGSNVTCRVHFQLGESISKNGTEKYPSDNPSDPQEKLPVPFVKLHIYIGVGIVLCLVILCIVLVICYCKIRRQTKPKLFTAEEVNEFMKGSVPLNTLSRNNPASATVLPYDVRLEVPREKIIFESTVLGQGAFGKVIKGRIGERFVAIKTIKKNVDGQYFRALLSELKIMTYVGKHPNIVELVGANTERIRKQDVFLIFEFCDNGCALSYIRGKRELFTNQLSEDFQQYLTVDSTVEYENGFRRKLCSEDLIRWAMEVAAGMEFIASKKVYHGDLAARNILLSHSLVAKVGDFGLAKELKDYSLYVQRMECPLPLKWMSIESLRDLEFSIQSDIWSYGVTLWEMFSLGSSPYPGVDWNFQSWKMLADGNRMDRPSHATQSIYNILLKCWQAEPQDRPSFGELKEMFRTELKKLDRREVLPQSKLQEVKVPPIREKDRRNRVMTWLR